MTAAPRPGRTPGQQALDLDADLAAGRRPAGRVERMVAMAVDAAVEADILRPDLDQGAVALAVALARAVDRGAHDPFAVAAAGRELSALLARLRLDPESRETPTDGAGFDADGWLARLTAPARTDGPAA